jgi:ankyrin repeat protein
VRLQPRYRLPVTSDWKAAVRAGDLTRLAALLAAGADIDAKYEHGQTALMIAARDGLTPVVRWLVEHGVDLKHTAKFHLSALMLAVINGRDAIVGILVDAGANRSLQGAGAPGFHGKTALDIAAAGGRDIMVALLSDPD